MGVHRTCGEPGGIKKNTLPKDIAALVSRAGAAYDYYDLDGWCTLYGAWLNTTLGNGTLRAWGRYPASHGPGPGPLPLPLPGPGLGGLGGLGGLVAGAPKHVFRELTGRCDGPGTLATVQHVARQQCEDKCAAASLCKGYARRQPFDATPMGVNPISPAHPCVRPMWALIRVDG